MLKTASVEKDTLLEKSMIPIIDVSFGELWIYKKNDSKQMIEEKVSTQFKSRSFFRSHIRSFLRSSVTHSFFCDHSK